MKHFCQTTCLLAVVMMVLAWPQSASAQSLMIDRAEYFWDDDPGYGQATALSLIPGDDISIERLIDSGTLAPGNHLLGVRYYGTQGWSPTIIHEVAVPASANLLVESAEYFWNTDPGFGKGTPIALTPGQDVTLEDVGIPSLDIHGDATLFVRYRSPQGWSPTVAFDVMVDAEGVYTLNSQAETSAETRNYQTLDDAIADWSMRGVGGNIDVTIPTATTDYALDATTDEVLAQFETLAASLDQAVSPQSAKIVTFAAAEDSGNTLSITTTDEGLPTVVSALTHTVTENVALTINGTAYDFSAIAQRHEKVCSGDATTGIALSAISSNIQASWHAVPHEGTTIANYLIDGEGDLASMTPTNSGTRLDSLAYEVTLSDALGTALTTYTYYIYVYPRISEQAFSGLTPTAGSSLDPGTVTLKWNAIGGAVGGYRVDVHEEYETDEADATYETEKTSVTISVASGHSYTWTVTAIGRCDELTSPTMTFTGRLLPDIAVESIVLPEAAEAGNTITVQATIRNSGEGATTETTWTDRLYYTIDSENFTTAVQAAIVTHTGVLAAGESYVVTFSMQVPQVDEGLLRVFVVTDATSAVMEADENNNRTLSATAATLAPFYMNTIDLAALRQLYTDFSGAQWTGTPWNTTSELITPDNWSGVTFNTEGRVTAINLSNRGLVGNTLNAETLAPMTALTSLTLSYNQIDELTGLLPSTITSLDLSYQHRVYNNNKSFPGLEAIDRQVVTVGQNGSLTLTDVVRYYHTAQNFDEHPVLYVYTPSYSQLGTLTWSAVAETYTFSAGTRKLTTEQDADVVLIADGKKCGHHSAMPATLHFIRGDANLSGLVDVNDVQRTLNYVLNSNNGTAFGHWSANTYTDDETEPVINIQDIVCTVDIVLENEDNSPMAHARRRVQTATEEQLASSVFYTDGRKVFLTTEEDLAAFDLELHGVSASQVRLLLNARDWQLSTRNTANGVRLLVFSPTGATLPVGTTELLRLGADAVPVAVQATSPEAVEVKAAVDTGRPTGLGTLPSDDESKVVYDLGGRKLEKTPTRRGIYIVNSKKVMVE